MCGILFVKSAADIPLQRHLTALQTLAPRGPDFVRYRHHGDTFVAQTVLRISGDSGWYQEHDEDFFTYNGEIYNYQDLGCYDSDVRAAHDLAKHQQWKKFKQMHGPWAWVYTNFENFSYASDPQGERCLYHYRSNDLTVVASTVAAILCYIDPVPQSLPYDNKGWTMIRHTPWQGIERCVPGKLYVNGQDQGQIDSIFDWIQPRSPVDLDQAVEEFQRIWQRVISTMDHAPATLSYSGGIDSELIRRSLPAIDPLAIDITHKDPIVDGLQCRKIAVDPKQWAGHYQTMIRATQMPAGSWSHVGKWLVAMHSHHRVIFTGLGADELFGGYAVYSSINYDQSQSHSPYSCHDHDGLWPQCLHSYQGDPRQATLLMDYWYQVVGVDAPGHDRLGGQWGRETRNPFMCQPLIKFALNLPWDLKVGAQAKPVLREVYRRNISTDISPKQGFAGHANDSLPWLDVEIDPTGDRHKDWKQIAQLTFSHYTTHR